GSEFVFGKMGARGGAGTGFVFAFQVLPTIIFIAAVFAILYYLAVMQVIVTAFDVGMPRLMGARGAGSLNVRPSPSTGQSGPPRAARGKASTWPSTWPPCSSRSWPWWP